MNGTIHLPKKGEPVKAEVPAVLQPDVPRETVVPDEPAPKYIPPSVARDALSREQELQAQYERVLQRARDAGT